LQLARILDEDDAVFCLSDLGEQRVGQRGLARRGAARDEDIGARGDTLAQRVGLSGGHNPGADIVFEREDRDGGLADGERRGRHDRRQQSLEPFSRLGQFG